MPRTVSAREPHPQSVGYLAKAITYATTGIGTANTVLLGVLPAGAMITDIVARVSAAFNAATTNVLIVGTAADDDAIIAAGDVTEGSIGSARVTTGLGTLYTADTPLYIKYSQTGTAATAGAATIAVTFIRASDG